MEKGLFGWLQVERLKGLKGGNVEWCWRVNLIAYTEVRIVGIHGIRCCKAWSMMLSEIRLIG